jgi:NADP-dependent 3-hydroxy acid dehydrogenase YdfG
MSNPESSRVVVITGASAGIGAALAREVHRRGGLPVLAARRADALAEVARECGGALAVTCDVTRRSDVEALRDAAIARYGRVDSWVNNAGRGITRVVSELTDDDVDEMVLVNVKSVLYGMQAILPHFKERGSGHIVNVSSMLGRIPFAPIRSAYSGAKHMMNALTANLRMELREGHPGITVSVFSPAVVRTEFGINARHGGFDSRSAPFSQSAEEVASLLADLLDRPEADAYSRPQFRAQVAGYYGAEDMAAFEAQMALR